jgi:hypothetical protein
MAPRSTRLTAVVDFAPAVPLFVFEHPVGSLFSNFTASSSSIQQTMEESRFDFTSISASVDESMVSNDLFRYVCVSFWVDHFQSPIFSVSLPMPTLWTPRVYLAALMVTIRQRRLVLSAPDNLFGSIYPTLNEVHWLYSQSIVESLSMLNIENAFRAVNGGEVYDDAHNV